MSIYDAFPNMAAMGLVAYPKPRDRRYGKSRNPNGRPPKHPTEAKKAALAYHRENPKVKQYVVAEKFGIPYETFRNFKKTQKRKGL